MQVRLSFKLDAEDRRAIAFVAGRRTNLATRTDVVQFVSGAVAAALADAKTQRSRFVPEDPSQLSLIEDSK